MNTLKLVVAAAVMLAACVAVGISFGRTSDQSKEGAEAHTAICALEHDLENRIRASEEFLHQHPNGIAGISRNQFVRSIRSQQASIAAFKRSGLDCSR